MTTRPATVPVWNSDGTNRVTPSVGQQTSGWTANQVPPSSYDNWYKYWMSQWAAFLNAATVDFGANGLAATALTANGAFTANSTLHAVGVATADSGLVVGANQHVTVSGTGEYKHGDRTLYLPSSSAQLNTYDGANAWKFDAYNGGTANAWRDPGTSGMILMFPVILGSGDRIKTVRAYVRDTTGHTITMRFRQNNYAIDTGSAVVTVVSSGSGTAQVLEATGLTYGGGVGTFYDIMVSNDTTTVTTHRVFGCEVVYDHP